MQEVEDVCFDAADFDAIFQCEPCLSSEVEGHPDENRLCVQSSSATQSLSSSLPRSLSEGNASVCSPRYEVVLIITIMINSETNT